MKLLKKFGSQIYFFTAGILTGLQFFNFSIWMLLAPLSIVIIGAVYAINQLENENVKGYADGVRDAKTPPVPATGEWDNPFGKPVCKICGKVATGEYGGEYYCQQHLEEIANTPD